MDADGDNPQNLTDCAEATDYAASWSPDGTTILFHSNRDGEFRTWLMDADGDNPRPLAGTDAEDHDQSWSPEDSSTRSIPYQALRSAAGVWSADGESVLITSHRDGNEEVYRIHVATGDRTRLTNHRSRDFVPTFVPQNPRGTERVPRDYP